MFLSFPSYDIFLFKAYSFFAWFALIPIFLYIREKSFKDILLISFITGLAGNLLVYNWIGAFGGIVSGGYIVVLAVLIPSLTVFFASKIIIAEFFSRKFEKLRFLIYPSIWIIIDWIQSIGFLAFPWTYWGYSQDKFLPFIQIASIAGIMGVTFFIILTNYLLSDFIFIKLKADFLEVNKEACINKAKTVGTSIERAIDMLYVLFKSSFKFNEFKRIIIIIILFVLILIYGCINLARYSNSNQKEFRAALIQSCISPWENWRMNRFKYLENLKLYTDLSLNENPDIIIWSESATLEHISYNYENNKLNTFETEVLDYVRSIQKPLLTGEIGIIEDNIHGNYYPRNNAVLINMNGEVLDSYSKINLVPFGEWFPYDKWFPFIQTLVDKFGASHFVPGDSPKLLEIYNRKFGSLICYEGIFFSLCRKYKLMGADFLVNITNDGWTDSYAGHMQHFSASVFRAIENGIWFLRSGNTGFTAIIDPCGSIKKSILILKQGYLIGDIDFSVNHSTFYVEYGDIFLYIVMGFIFILAIVLLFKIKIAHE